MSEECRHEAAPRPEMRSRVVRNPLGFNPSRIVDCIHCGAPLLLPRDTRVMMSKDWLEERTGSEYEGPCADDPSAG